MIPWLDDILEKLNELNTNQTITVTEQEAMVAGDICISTDGGFIPFSSLTPEQNTIIGDPLGVSAGSVNTPAVVWGSNNVALHVVGGADGILRMVRFEENGDITIGPDYIFYGAAVFDTDICSLKDKRFAITYCIGTTVGDAKVVAGRWFDELTAEFGDIETLDTNDCNRTTICAHDDYRFQVAWNDTISTLGETEACTVDPDTYAITEGGIVSVDSGNSTNNNCLTKLSTGKTAWTWQDAVDTFAWCAISTIAVNTITKGNDVAITAVLTTPVTCVAVGASLIVGMKVVADAQCYAATISGTVPTFGNITTYNTVGPDKVVNLLNIDDVYFLFTWRGQGVSKAGIVISSVSGNTITEGIVYEDEDESHFGMVESAKHGHIGDINDFGIIIKLTTSGIVFHEIGWIDDNYTIYDITGVVKDDAGLVTVDGISEGDASDQNIEMTYFIDSVNHSVKKASHGCSRHRPRIRVLDTDALKVIGG